MRRYNTAALLLVVALTFALLVTSAGCKKKAATGGAPAAGAPAAGGKAPAGGAPVNAPDRGDARPVAKPGSPGAAAK